MKKFFKGFFKVLLVLVLMFACFIGGIEVGKQENIDNDNRQAYSRGYDAAKAIYYNPNKSTSADDADPTKAPTDTPTSIPEQKTNKPAADEKTINIKVNSKTYAIRQSVKDELDAYEEYWDKYIESIKSAKNNDPISYLSKYTEMLQKLEEIEKHSSEIENMTDDENSYYAYRIMEINQKMLQATLDLQ